MTRARLALAAALAAAACASVRRGSEPPVRMVRLGPERTEVTYEDARRGEKHRLLERINQDRARHGVPAVLYEPRASLVGDLFCLDAALAASWGHWDAQGRAPYVRWGLAGGVDFHAENTAAYSVSSGRITRPLADLLLETHEVMMAERPPDDGHRRTILDPIFTHVGIGMAAVGGQFRMSEEFTRVVFEWIEVPERPLPAGSVAQFTGRPSPGWEVGLIEVRFEPPPRPLSLLELRKRGAYGYPRVVRSLTPPAHAGTLRAAGAPGDFEAGRDGIRVKVPLSSGPGHYFVLCYLRAAGNRGESMRPATAAMITAFPEV